jgi:hypothetical protein
VAKLIFIVNKIPESNDQSYDYFRRWIMLFEKTFQGVDTSLIEELTTEEELLGLSNPAIFFLQAPLNHKIVAKILSSKRTNGLGISCPPFFRIPLHLETRRIMHGCFSQSILTSQALIRGTELTLWPQVIPSMNIQLSDDLI